MPEEQPWWLSKSLLLLPESDVIDGTAEVFALEPRCGGETATLPYGAGYASGILDACLMGMTAGRE